MILFGVLATLIPLSYCQNAVLGFEKTCYKVDDTLTIDAVYNGTGTPQLVTWTYSGSNLIVETTGCTLFNNVPAGFPNASRITQKCVTTDLSLPENTYQLIVSDLLKDELGKTWAVTFTPPVGAAPTAVQSPVPSDCSSKYTLI
ncbi:uncharacterized protein LOC132738210 [Ruditapes philippinarum]|uniref:uncharacterized protein LOC132738210 n=1 Tax=Ruditapes philippinarum TaxID=129788 RepID=UPI00295B32CC|nr:uncharacterized protein LOC132738210 [Ruditapes philippinarum]